ncbi:TraR/DksA C4-type zinc finger protein [Candidatus Uhrbacteria bacterium]|nr:TraR/DksA C4-type zinc finger protein [Candidatus Uhrbacteria bacterium]
MRLEKDFLEGQMRHLENKRAKVMSRLRQEMPALHREDKVRRLLPAILRAILRIKDGGYGICADCGEDIALARLELRPEAERCVDCQKEAEADGIIRV